ncbi:hypothetical protein Mapa_014493 [Marchantia paleacea]|nr:hypothetical protein Mapa_014493 [Marchantia paleacea]
MTSRAFENPRPHLMRHHHRWLLYDAASRTWNNQSSSSSSSRQTMMIETIVRCHRPMSTNERAFNPKSDRPPRDHIHKNKHLRFASPCNAEIPHRDRTRNTAAILSIYLNQDTHETYRWKQPQAKFAALSSAFSPAAAAPPVEHHATKTAPACC